MRIPIPPIDFQKSLVAEIGAEQALVAANRERIIRMEAKILAVMDRVWGRANASSLAESA